MERERIYGAAIWMALALSCAASPADDPRALAAEAKKSYDAKDYPAFVEKMKRALESRPTHETYLYNLAVGYALMREKKKAIALLNEAAAIGYTYAGLDKDSDFDGIRADADFNAVRKKLAENASPIVRSVPAITLREKGIVAEGLAHDPASGAFLIGSIFQRKIIRVDKDVTAADFSVPADGLWSMLGMKVDPARRQLWACTAAQPLMRDAKPQEDGTTALCQYDLATKKLLKKYVLPNSSGKHLFGDLTVSSAGDVYATDSIAPQIYKLARGNASLELLVEGGPSLNLQGLVLTPDEKHLMVADYSMGLFLIDLARKRLVNLPAPPHTTLMGIDGLYADGHGGLIAVQNGITPNRIVRIRLNTDWTRAEKVEVLESNNPIADEPTLGVVVGDDFFFNGNSQWSAISEKGDLAPAEKLREPIVFRLPL